MQPLFKTELTGNIAKWLKLVTTTLKFCFISQRSVTFTETVTKREKGLNETTQAYIGKKADG